MRDKRRTTHVVGDVVAVPSANWVVSVGWPAAARNAIGSRGSIESSRLNWSFEETHLRLGGGRPHTHTQGDVTQGHTRRLSTLTTKRGDLLDRNVRDIG